MSRAGDAIADMAYFTARDDKPADYCQDRVRGCDVYVGLIGLRYGTPVRDKPEVSYTELEFDTATEAGLPRLVFLLDEDAAVPIPPGRLLDGDPGLQARQRAFRARLLDSGVMAAKFASPSSWRFCCCRRCRKPARQAEPPLAAGHGGQASGAAGSGRPGPRGRLAGRRRGWRCRRSRWRCWARRGSARARSAWRRCTMTGWRSGSPAGGGSSAVTAPPRPEALLSGLAAELGVTGDGSPGSVMDRVCAVLGAGLAVVVLDNFETPWTADPLPVEELLRTIAAIPQVGVAVSCPGDGPPGGAAVARFRHAEPAAAGRGAAAVPGRGRARFRR